MSDSVLSRIFPVLLRSGISLALLLVTGVIIARMMIPEEVPHAAASGVLTPVVEVVSLQQHETGIDFSVDGEVIPFRRLDLVAEVSGRVVYKSEQCRLGRYVKKGELLMQIDPVDYQLAVDQAKAAVSQAKVSIDENSVQKTNTEKELALAGEQLELVKKDFDRSQQLAAQKTITPAELERAQSSLLSIQEVIQRLENQLRVLSTQTERLAVQERREELAWETAQLNLARTEVKAPMSGVITEDSFEVNSFIQKGANVAKILDTSQLEIQCSLYMKQIQWIWRQSDESRSEPGGQHVPGQAVGITGAAAEILSQRTGYVFTPTPVTIRYEMDGERWAWEGELKTLDGGIMNPITRMVPCRVKVDNPQSGKRINGNLTESAIPPMLFAGMYVTVIVHSKPDISLYRIPERALLPGNKIWTVVEGKLQQHSIRIASTTLGDVLFYADSESIRPNDLVVVSPLASPTEGSPVQTIRSSVF